MTKPRRPWHSATIAGKLVGGFLLISLVPLIALLVLTQHLSHGLMRQMALGQLQQMAQQKVHMADAFAQSSKQDVAKLAQLPMIGQLLRRDASVSNDRRVSLSALADFGGYDDILLITPDRRVLYSTANRFPENTDLTNPSLSDGGLVKLVDKVLTSRQGGLSVFANITDPGGPSIYSAAPVLQNDELIGILAAQIDRQELWQELTDTTGLGDTGEVVLAMRDGDNLVTVAPLRSNPDAAFHQHAAAKDNPHLASAIDGGWSLGDSVDYRGVETLAVWASLPSLGWGMEVKIDRAEALALVSKQRQLVATIAVLTLVAVVILALFASRSLTQPIRVLTAAVRRMSAGDLSQRVHIDADDELGELGRAFNRMTADLRNVWNTIEQQVWQRTRELEESNREAQKARDELRKFFRAVESSPMSVIITDLDGIIEYVNPHFTESTGYTAEEAQGRRPNLVASGETSSQIYQSLWSTIKSGGEWRGEFLNRHKDGRTFWEAAFISPVREPGGAITHFIAIEHDITAQKTSEQHLRSAKDAAEDASRAKSEFLAVMSHEIRTPMNGILGMTQLMLDTPLSALQRDYLDTVRHSGEALLTLLNDILDFSKLEAGRVELESADFDLPGTIDQVINLMTARARERRLTIQAEIAPDVPRFLRGDQGRLRQVLLNLVGNAVKFTEKGSIRVVVDVEPLSEGAPAWPRAYRFSVIDTGIGISQDVQERLFQSFSQADTSISRRYGGSGLGLAICRRLVELHGGQIGVSSQPGQGSTFWFTVSYDQGAPLQRTASGGSTSGALPRMRILLAEDNAVNRKVAIALLEKWGHRITSVEDGQSAIAAVETEPFDLVLMDVQMPGMDGLEATRKIRALPGQAGRVPVIALTANAMRGDEQRCLEAGMDDYLSKPIEQDRLFQALDRVCQRRAMGRISY